jgi:hypothetical protein
MSLLVSVVKCMLTEKTVHCLLSDNSPHTGPKQVWVLLLRSF